jgi:hypothetical protein
MSRPAFGVVASQERKKTHLPKKKLTCRALHLGLWRSRVDSLRLCLMCVCVCERERERVCVCERERERVCVCVSCVCVCKADYTH